MAVGPQQSSLLKLLDFSQCECRNEASAESLVSLLKTVAEGKGSQPDQEGGEAPLLASADEDPQLFISLAAPRGTQAKGEAPRVRTPRRAAASAAAAAAAAAGAAAAAAAAAPAGALLLMKDWKPLKGDEALAVNDT
ncbi:hypothetical protein ACSSS7_006764 [Eimeria intestinalis]